MHTQESIIRNLKKKSYIRRVTRFLKKGVMQTHLETKATWITHPTAHAYRPAYKREKFKFQHPMIVKMCTRGFSRSLITNLISDFQNSRWRIQYGGHRNVIFQE